ncbi:hypothetical protein AURDEDRAFT_164373 [Auricularia subglabra TFB-10046 SS5]|nr:hypothetical protein AURDEDRAFT_164373 [Auricularia subglabra TFB-10046 SS5]
MQALALFLLSTFACIGATLTCRNLVSGVEVVYGTSAAMIPSDSVKEISGQSSDINFQFKGKYVWLRPVFTTNTSDAATGFQLVVSKNAAAGGSDLAAGTGGSYRYINPTSTAGTPQVTQLALYRTNKSLSAPPQGYYGMTGDININRGKSYLYLIWRA